MFRASASLLLALALGCRAEWTGKHPTAWTNDAAVATADVWAASVTIVVTNWTATNATVVTTNTFLDPILGDAVWANNPWTGTYGVTVQRFGTNGVGFFTNETRIVTNALAQTSAVLRAREIISMDVWRAVRERAQAIGTNWPVHYVYRRALYDGHRQNLVNCKSWLNAHWQRFVDRPKAAAGFTNWTDTAGSFRLPPLPTNRSVFLAYGGAPTNWLDYTPYRQLNGYGIALTNTNTVAGTSELDYGYKYALNVLTNLAWTRSAVNWLDGQDQQSVAADDPSLWVGTGATTWNGATCGVTAAWTSFSFGVANPCEPTTTAYNYTPTDESGNLPARWAEGYQFASVGASTYVAQAYARWMSFRHGVGTTNIAHAADLWLARATNWPATYQGTSTVYTLDEYGYTFPPSMTYTGTYYSVTSSLDFVTGPTIGEATNAAAVPTMPTAPAAGATPTVRGYALTNAAWLIRWDVPGGFQF